LFPAARLEKVLDLHEIRTSGRDQYRQGLLLERIQCELVEGRHRLAVLSRRLESPPPQRLEHLESHRGQARPQDNRIAGPALGVDDHLDPEPQGDGQRANGGRKLRKLASDLAGRQDRSSRSRKIEVGRTLAGAPERMTKKQLARSAVPTQTLFGEAVHAEVLGHLPMPDRLFFTAEASLRQGEPRERRPQRTSIQAHSSLVDGFAGSRLGRLPLTRP
jgi:hypothetical protein